MKLTTLKMAVVVVVGGGLAGCQVLGPQAINAGRAEYNEAIQETSKQQSLGNIVRVYKRQPPLFMDVTEVAATTQMQAQLVATLQNAAAPAGTTRTRTNQGTFQYLESPLVRYVPVLGSALTTQVATPISVDSLAFLTDSNWSLAPVLTFAVNYLTPGYAELYPALNAMFELYETGALLFAQSKSDLTGQGAGSSNNSAPLNDSLVLYLVPRNPLSSASEATEDRVKILHLWLRLLRIYAGTQPQTSDPQADARLAIEHLDTVEAELNRLAKNPSADLEDFLEKQFGELRNWIELRMAPVVPSVPPATASAPRKTGCAPGKGPAAAEVKNCSYLGPLMRTRSALGILKAATEAPGPMIEFVSVEKYKEISSAKWNADKTHYTLTAKQESPTANPDTTEEDKQITQTVSKWIEAQPRGASLLNYNINSDVRSYRDVKLERRLGRFRRFVLVIETDSAPQNAYVSFRYQGRSYYIAADDEISQRNFVLLSQFTIMQATPSPSTFTPTISVGAK